jgi:competence protein ComEA
MAMAQTPQFQSFTTQPLEAVAQQQPSQEQTAPQPELSAIPESVPPVSASLFPLKRKFTRIIAIIIILALAITIYFIWHTPATTNPSPVITQQNFGGTSSNSNTGNALTTNGDLHIYVVGAVKHPGVYILPTGARVYLLLQAAGGPLQNANLVALNLAAPLSDGEEVCVPAYGEKSQICAGGVPGTGTGGSTTAGQLVNINTASADEMRQSLHISATTAQSIVNYRQQNGSYTSIDQLQLVISKTIYTRIKGLITI